MRKQKIISSLIEKHPISAGIAVGAAKSVAMSIITNQINRRNIATVGHGRARSERFSTLIEKHPAIAALGVVAVSPLVEELLARHAPHKLAERHPHYRRHVEIGAAVLFALGHAGPNGIPLSQAVGGITYNELYKRGGLKASFAAHATNNLISTVKYAHAERMNRETIGKKDT